MKDTKIDWMIRNGSITLSLVYMNNVGISPNKHNLLIDQEKYVVIRNMF